MFDALRRLTPRQQFSLTIAVAMTVCVGLLSFGRYYADSGRFDYLLWNLFLAALPLIFALRLKQQLQTKRWTAWKPLLWSLLWLLFLPNSFYMISDFIHLREVSRANILYDAIMFSAFINVGVLLGFCSLYEVHRLLRQRLRALAATAWVGLTLLICASAIYIGRDLRWNSWDVLINPAGLLFDVSDRLLRPNAYPDMLVTIGGFFALLSGLYAIVWSAARVVRSRA